MNITECPSCAKELKETASFCGKCKTQVKCLNCKESITLDDECCESCGKDIEKRNSNIGAINKIRFDGTSFEAEFTDNVGKDVTATLGQILIANQGAFSSKQLAKPTSIKTSDSETIDINAEDVTEVTPLKKKTIPTVNNNIATIFRETGDRLELIETRIKASGKGNYTARLTYLIVLYYQLKGEKAKKASIISLLDFCSLYDSNFRTWFPKQKADFLVQDGLVELRPAGKQKAQNFLSDVFDDNAIDQWGLGDLKSSGTSTKSKSPKTNDEKTSTPTKTSSKGGRAASDELKMLDDLDLNPKNGQGFKDFVGLYKTSSNFERNLVYTYYLKEVLKLQEPINYNHIYTCYRWLDEKFPNAFTQSIKDTKSNKQWLSYSKLTDIKVSPKGMNHIKDLKIS